MFCADYYRVRGIGQAFRTTAFRTTKAPPVGRVSQFQLVFWDALGGPAQPDTDASVSFQYSVTNAAPLRMGDTPWLASGTITINTVPSQGTALAVYLPSGGSFGDRQSRTMALNTPAMRWLSTKLKVFSRPNRSATRRVNLSAPTELKQQACA